MGTKVRRYFKRRYSKNLVSPEGNGAKIFDFCFDIVVIGVLLIVLWRTIFPTSLSTKISITMPSSIPSIVTTTSQTMASSPCSTQIAGSNSGNIYPCSPITQYIGEPESIIVWNTLGNENVPSGTLYMQDYQVEIANYNPNEAIIPEVANANIIGTPTNSTDTESGTYYPTGQAFTSRDLLFYTDKSVTYNDINFILKP